MRPRFVVYAIVATVLIGGTAFAADALVVSDREQLEELADELTESPRAQRVEAVLRWTDLSRVEVSVTRDRDVQRFEDQEDYALAEEVADALAPFTAGDLEVVQRSVSIDGDRATVAVRVRAEGSLHDATLRLARSGQGWLVTDLRTR